MSEIVNMLVPMDVIKPHQRNYRAHPDEQLQYLRSSHSRFGQYRSVVLWQRPGGEYITVAGHGIIQAMTERGVKEIRADVLPPETPQETIDAILVADNNIALSANDDETMLAAILQEQQDAGFNLASLGTDDEALRQMLEALGDEVLSTGEEDSMSDVQFKEYDETIEDGLDTEMCQECGKLCLKNGGKKKDA